MKNGIPAMGKKETGRRCRRYLLVWNWQEFPVSFLPIAGMPFFIPRR
jgi:hypothetical protein